MVHFISRVFVRWSSPIICVAVLATIILSSQAAFAQQPPAVAELVEHWAHQASLFIFASAKTVWFVVVTLWLRRRTCRSFNRLMFAAIGAVLWLAGVWVGRHDFQMIGVLILCVSHTTECLLHALNEARENFKDDNQRGK